MNQGMQNIQLMSETTLESTVNNILIEAMSIGLEDIQDIRPLGGMTNKNYGVIVLGKEYVLRIPGNGTDQLINRKEEKVNVTIASEIGLDAELIYFNDKTGVKITEMIKDAETLTRETANKPKNMRLTSRVIKRLHHSGEKMLNHFNVFEKIDDYERLMWEANAEPYKGYEAVREKVIALKEIYQGMNIELAPCHNDLIPENFVKSGNDNIYLIDWEYSGMNDPMWDVAAFSLECGLSTEEEEFFLSLYFNGSGVPLEVQQRLLMNKIFQDFLWSIWTIIKEAKGDDFGTYGLDRFNRAVKNLNHDLIKEAYYEYKK